MTSVESFRSPWPEVLVEMKDYLDLYFLSRGKQRQSATIRIFISKSLVRHTQLQPHVQRFKASLTRIPDCRVEFRGTEESAHKIEIETTR